MRAVRSFAGVAAGCALMVGAMRVAGEEQFLRVVCILIAGAMAAGFVTAWIAGHHEFPHAAAVGFVMVAMGFLSMRSHRLERPGWYEITLAGCGPIAAMVGAAIRVLNRRRN